MDWCKIIGHKWIPVYINKKGKFKFIATYCGRCRFGNDELLDFVEKNVPLINTYSEEYFYDREQLNDQKDKITG